MRIQYVDLLLCYAFTAYECDYDMKNMFNLSNKELNIFMFYLRNKKERNEMYHYIHHPDSKGNRHLITSC